ncbi:hypothetical protein A7J50_1189 [Pseudomonas antarctica]|uniref:Tip attachment protein J central straight fiber domain-containing protein n=1 Tax=Pseudomonas antarctica TaxID=219572 RepID=A0A172YX41_9PSED|nr:DUF1983 domain-containing protein [Pseudomonas antarctica]ANF84628.1 hypothetical protein A7J50_1189 [Pseudomonas antarctica]
MSDPKLQAVGAQLSALSTQIQTESAARVAADAALAARIGSIETARVGDIQSANYVPGVSGWKLNSLTGEFEINSCTLGSAANAPERQMVSVEVSSWSKYDLPKNAANLLQFMQAELQKVAEEYRHAAEFEEFDASYGDESFNARLFLSYSRLETEEELADRLKKAEMAGSHISIKNGVTTVSCNGVVRYTIGNLDQPEPEQPLPFRVDGDKVYLSEATIQDGIIKSPWPAAWGVRMKLAADGKCYAAGIGLGLSSQFITAAEKFAIKYPTEFERKLAGGVDAVLDAIAGKISETKLGQDLKEQADKLTPAQADQVKEVIRAELRQGGLLWRRR